MSFLVGILARWGLPAGLRRPLAFLAAALALLALLATLKGCYDRGVIADHDAEVAAQVAAKADAGAQAAASASAATQNQVENSNEQARQAAAGSDDPLRAGLDRLRAGPPAHRPAPR